MRESLNVQNTGGLVQRQSQKREAELLESHVTAWLSKRQRCLEMSEINANFLVDLS